MLKFEPMQIQRYFNIFTIILFCSLIFSPSLVMFFSEKEKWSRAEKRSLATLPLFPESIPQIPAYFLSVNEYLQDHFGFRHFFIHRYQRELKKRFNKVITSKVIEGLDGWLFYDDFGLIDDFFGHTPLSEKELGLWLQEIQQRQRWLGQKGIRYLHIIAPNKQSLYPQYIMKNGEQLKGVTRFEQLEQRLSPSFPDYMLNLHTALYARLNEGRLYFKNDTHWNRRGAYFAYQKIIERLSQWFPEETFRDDFKFDKDKIAIGGNIGHGGDLLNMIGGKNKTEELPVLKPFLQYSKRNAIDKYGLSEVKRSSLTPSFSSICEGKQLRAVVFRDSFFAHVEIFFSENFKEVIYLWKRYNQKNIEEIIRFWKPDIVMEMTVERHAFDFLHSESHPTHTP